MISKTSEFRTVKFPDFPSSCVPVSVSFHGLYSIQNNLGKMYSVSMQPLKVSTYRYFQMQSGKFCTKLKNNMNQLPRNDSLRRTLFLFLSSIFHHLGLLEF